jgi:hypothetical protein
MGQGANKAQKRTTILSLVSGPHTEQELVWCRFVVTRNTIVTEENIFYDSYEDAKADLSDLKAGPLDLLEERDIYDEYI